MELRQIRYFKAVAEERSFTRGAQRVAVSQPPLSLQIKKLEEELGSELFVRGRTEVTLTTAGAALLPNANRILAAVADAVEAVQNAAKGVTGVLRIGFVASASFDLIPRFVRALQARHPRIEVRLVDGTTRKQIELIHSGELDFGLVRLPIDDGRLVSSVIKREKFVFVANESHPLAVRNKPVRLAELKDETFVFFPRKFAPPFFDLFISSCNSAGFSPSILHELEQIQTCLDVVASGIGVSVQPESVRSVRSAGLAYLPIEDFDRHAEIGLIHAENATSPIILSAIEIARELFPN